jgi:hypothetical protein
MWRYGDMLLSTDRFGMSILKFRYILFLKARLTKHPVHIHIRLNLNRHYKLIQSGNNRVLNDLYGNKYTFNLYLRLRYPPGPEQPGPLPVEQQHSQVSA